MAGSKLGSSRLPPQWFGVGAQSRVIKLLCPITSGPNSSPSRIVLPVELARRNDVQRWADKWHSSQQSEWQAIGPPKVYCVVLLHAKEDKRREI